MHYQTDEIISQADAEIKALDRTDGRVVYGWHRRYRKLLVKAGMDRNNAIYILNDIERK